MNISDVKKRWGNAPLSVEKFKNGKPEDRAKMAYDLLKNQKKFYGWDIPKVREQFGRHDGYYFVDIYPAYLIELGQNRSEDTWQIVFLMDRERKISEIVVHKNCCDD